MIILHNFHKYRIQNKIYIILKARFESKKIFGKENQI